MTSQRNQEFSKKFGIIGTGVMGKSLIQGILHAQLATAKEIWATAKTEATCQKVTQTLGVEAFTDYKKILPNTQWLLLCVKPHQVLGILAHLVKQGLSENTGIISVATGVSLTAMTEALGQNNPVIRAMPNTPCVVGKGMTVICGGESVKSADLATARSIFTSVGHCIELEESHFNAVTALGGSGPAYFYLIMEALADGGVRVGLPRDVALEIVCQTVLGAATMVQQTGRHPAALRDDVTTPAGCTIAALLTMEDGKIRSVLARAVEEATRIAGQLGEKK
ncbi:MAG: pyrroline-5-carboxylate reductase [Cyanobacteria bacterium]|nr:pyrroline-5-carboxylate reductase [Cyanobacteriota bacterium]